MVNIVVFVEGGVIPQQNPSAQTFINSEKLREGFHKLLSQIAPEEGFNLEIRPGADFARSTQAFLEFETSEVKVLILDLDRSKIHRLSRLQELGLVESQDHVYFMIQEMEAWILSQPDIIEGYCSDHFIRSHSAKVFSEDPVFKLNPEDITYPSEKLHVVLARYFLTEKIGRMVKLKYGKLKHGPAFIARLNANRLSEMFVDVQRLKAKLQSASNISEDF
jgi:hypothetical protein